MQYHVILVVLGSFVRFVVVAQTVPLCVWECGYKCQDLLLYLAAANSGSSTLACNKKWTLSSPSASISSH